MLLPTPCWLMLLDCAFYEPMRYDIDIITPYAMLTLHAADVDTPRYAIIAAADVIYTLFFSLCRLFDVCFSPLSPCCAFAM